MAEALKTEVLSLRQEQLIRRGDAMLLLGCGDGLTGRWREARLPATGPAGILFTDGGPASIGGLYSFLAAMRDARRRARITLLHSLTDERVGALVGAFLQAEGADYEIELDADLPGRSTRIGPFQVELRPALRGVGFRITADGASIELRSGHDA